MTFFEDAVMTAKNVTSAVGEKTGKIIDVSRLRISAAEISKEITRRYEALGRAVYDAKKADNDISGLVAECVRSIDALYSRMDEVNAKIAKLKDKKYCEKCGAVLEKTALYCSRCGSRVETRRGNVFVDDKPEKQDTAADENAKDIAENFADKVEDIKSDIKNKTEDAAEVFSNIADGLGEKLSDAADDIADKAEDIGGKIEAAAGDISEDDIAASIINIED